MARGDMVVARAHICVTFKNQPYDYVRYKNLMSTTSRSAACETPEAQLRWGRCGCTACKSHRAECYRLRTSERLRKSQKTPEYRAKRSEQRAELYKCPIRRGIINERNRLWRIANPEAILAKKAKGRAVKRNALPSWYGELDRFVMIEAADLCRLREIATGFAWQVDHMIPLQAKVACGLHCAYNIQLLPSFINRSKGRKMIYTEPFEWMKNN